MISTAQSLPRAALARDLERAFDREARTGVVIALAARGLWFAFSLIEFVLNVVPSRKLMPAHFQFPMSLVVIATGYNIISVVFFAVALRSSRPMLWCALSMALDLVGLAELKFFWLWAPPMVAHLPIFLEVRYLDFAVFFLLVAIYMLPISRRLVAWTGALCALLWAAGIVRAFLRFPGATIYWGPLGKGVGSAALVAMKMPNIVIADDFLVQLVLLGVFTLMLMLAVEEGRHFVVARVSAESERAVLARLFAPSVVARILGSRDASFAPTRRRVAVLFAAVPQAAAAGDFAALEAYYTLVEDVVFAHGGMLDRFDGSPAMAAFGALDGEAEAGRKALDCARALARRLAAAGYTAPIGLHAGEAVCGEAGGARNRVFSVIGDVVNAARRILELAEERALTLVVSDDALRQAGEEKPPAADLDEVRLRGRDRGLHLWSVVP